jgi:Raf kinase inhibitor-like YbhB/YbcL family protein
MSGYACVGDRRTRIDLGLTLTTLGAPHGKRIKGGIKMLVKRHLFTTAVVTLALGFAATAANAAGIFTLQSTTFQDGQLMPKKVANSRANIPSGPVSANCVGENVSPELHWSNVPDGTNSLVLLMFDPEGRPPGGVSHWVAYGISPTLTGFAEGATSKDSSQYVGGKSLMGVGHYSGPCTPPNQTPHHYTFVLIATDFAPTDLPPGLTRDELIAKFGPPPAHLKGVTGMVGLFVNPYPK